MTRYDPIGPFRRSEAQPGCRKQVMSVSAGTGDGRPFPGRAEAPAGILVVHGSPIAGIGFACDRIAHPGLHLAETIRGRATMRPVGLGSRPVSRRPAAAALTGPTVQ